MLSLSRWKIDLVGLSVVFGLLFSLPNALPQDVRDSLPGFVPKQTLNLGLDLQGGSYLLLEVDLEALRAERLTNMVEDVRSTLRDEQIAFADTVIINPRERVEIAFVAAKGDWMLHCHILEHLEYGMMGYLRVG